MKIIALANQKGGVAKTTTTSQMAWGLADRGKKVLAIDFDPQGNLTTGMGISLHLETPTVLDWLGLGLSNKPVKFEQVVKRSENVDVMPANIMLANGETVLFSKLSREKFLINQIETIKKNYDYILIDCQPSLGILTINALTAADEILVPMKPEYFCCTGAEQLIGNVRSIKSSCNPKLKFNGFLITMIDNRRKADDYIDNIKALAASVNCCVYESYIRNTAACADVSSFGTSIFKQVPKSLAAKDYNNFIDEFLEKEKK